MSSTAPDNDAPPPPIYMTEGKFTFRLLIILIISAIIAQTISNTLTSNTPYVYGYIQDSVGLTSKGVDKAVFGGVALFLYDLTPRGVIAYLKTLYKEWRTP